MMITPMLAASGPLPEDSAKWAYEVKWDGFRALLQASRPASPLRAGTATT
jgi:ATP-dependent DNA ligase